jgi:uncharacterized caspase-like protein
MAGKFALIVGNSRYNDDSLGRLKAPEIDVHELESVLKSPEVGHFDEVATLLNQDCASVRRAIARFYDQRQRDDLLLLYFSGHGVKDEQGHLYLALRDTESRLLAGSAIETAFITERMDRSFSKRQVLVLDCCHSGAFARGAKAAQGVSVGTAEAFEGTGLGRVVLTATDSTQYAWEGDQILGDAQNSLFTHFLIDGLKTGAADRDNDGVVTVDELYDYVREQVVTTTPRQTPHKWSYLQQGDIVVAQNPFAKRPVLPAEIEEAIGSKLSGLRLEAVGHLESLLHGHQAGRAHAALAALKTLSLDDSRKVANAAAQALKTHGEESGGTIDAIPGMQPAAADTRDAARPADIFISYAHEDHEKARALANVLAARGWKVWWDRKIAPGEAYDVVIERELSTCKCAIVLWSARSVHATWVRNEARRAARRKVLLPILIDAVEMPLEFENLQAADLTSWDRGEHPELETVVDRILALSPIPNDALARDAVEQARREVRAGRRKTALLRLEQFRPPHYLVSRALGELRAEGERLERERAEAARREAEAARATQERAETARREAEAARVEQEREEAARREAEAARLEHERVEAARREAEAARIEREREETARIDRERTEAARVTAERPALRHRPWKVEDARVEPLVGQVQWRDAAALYAPSSPDQGNQKLDPVVDFDPPTSRLTATGRLLIAAAALVALIAATWFAGIFPRRAVDAGSGPPRRQAPVAHTSPPPTTRPSARPEPPALESTSAPTTGVTVPEPAPEGAPPVVAAAPEASPKEPAERLATRPAPSRRLDDLRTLALRQAQTGARAEALTTAAAGLRIDARDPVLKDLVGSLLRDAQASARRAREDAIESNAADDAEEQFQQGLKREREAARLQRAGRLDAATRAFWGAADEFNAAATESRETANQAKAAAEQERRRGKAPDPAPAPAPTQPQQNPTERAAAERPLVDQALRRYEAAYASLRVNNVRSVYPSAPVDQLAKEFADNRSYTLTVEVDAYQFVFTNSLTAATITVRITRDIVPKTGPRSTKVDQPHSIQLEKQGGSWIIRQILAGVAR